MKRIQLFEFEDFPWLPQAIRTGVTNLIVVFHKMTGTHQVLSDLLLKVREKHPFRKITDLGSGSGGAMPEVVALLNQQLGEEKIHLELTDLHPNPSFIREFEKNSPDHYSYRATSLDAARLNEAPEGLKTMINSFHHMPPDKAGQILRSAQEHKTPLLIYEMAQNKIPTLLWWLFLPLSLLILIVMVLFMTPFVRPLSWQQLLFTYLIPVIPLVYAWDGQASLVRMYSFSDIEEILGDFSSDEYSWEVAPAPKANGKELGYYILGLPR